MTVHPRGSFGHVPLAGLTEHFWPPHNYEELYMGLPVAGQHLWGSFDVAGRRAVPIRQVQNDLAIRFMLFDGTDGEPLNFTIARQPFTGICDVDTREGRWGLWQPGAQDRFAFATGETSALWREPGEFEVFGEPVGDAMQLAVPDAEDPLGYRARWWRVSGGTRNGELITGVFAHEQVYVRPGSGWFSSSYCQDLEQVWVVFYTEYEDGTVHHGHFERGREGFAFAVVQRSDGAPVITTDLGCEPTFDAAGFPEGLVFTLGDGSVWNYSAPQAGGGQMPIPGPYETTPRWREGSITPAGETRRVTFAHAWAEAFPARFA